MTGAPPTPPLTLLWALRSPCDLACQYCYFGTIEEHRVAPPDRPGVLSHLATDDLDLGDILAFAATLPGAGVHRVILAGGEPLIWPHTLTVAAAITTAGARTVLCTNGIPLNRPHIVDGILATGIEAVSVSVDSADAAHHDTYRPARGGPHGHRDVLTGVEALLAARGASPTPRVGLYTVVTARNLRAVTEVADLAERLGCDYVVPQPISLPTGHPLDGELSLTAAHAPQLRTRLDHLVTTTGLGVPGQPYPQRFLDAIHSSEPLDQRDCFGGRTLFFIEPDGSVWDCPSGLRIAATAPERRRSIRGAHALNILRAEPGCADCSLFSRDCVNMWPLIGFDAMLSATGSTPRNHAGPAAQP